MKGRAIFVITLSLLILELIIYLAAASQSGTEHYVVIEDSAGRVLYKTPGKALTRYEEISFRSTFGPVENYRVRVVSVKRPFPFRGWLASAVGIPVGLVLLIAFAVKSYQALFEYKTGKSSDKPDFSDLRGWKYLFHLLSSFSVFQLGFMVAVLALFVWVVPNLTETLLKSLMSFVDKHVFWVVAIFLFIGGLIVWVVYLRYRISKEIVRYQFELARAQLGKAEEINTSEDIPLLKNQPDVVGRIKEIKDEN